MSVLDDAALARAIATSTNDLAVTVDEAHLAAILDGTAAPAAFAAAPALRPVGPKRSASARSWQDRRAAIGWSVALVGGVVVVALVLSGLVGRRQGGPASGPPTSPDTFEATTTTRTPSRSTTTVMAPVVYVSADETASTDDTGTSSTAVGADLVVAPTTVVTTVPRTVARTAPAPSTTHATAPPTAAPTTAPVATAAPTTVVATTVAPTTTVASTTTVPATTTTLPAGKLAVACRRSLPYVAVTGTWTGTGTVRITVPWRVQNVSVTEGTFSASFLIDLQYVDQTITVEAVVGGIGALATC